jgi:hypothetical protein
MNFIEILTSWLRSINPNKEQKYIAENRINICNGCENKSFDDIFGIFLCKGCNCPISKKIYSSDKEECPLKKWII